MNQDAPPNRLVHETSPYLLQHAHNPVHWQPWDEAALAQARAEDKPVFLSIGYSSCHWCHVMEKESFEDAEVAALLNRYFIPIKVDREERPDLDELYMTATQLMTGRGGWPNSVWLMPDGRPWYAGTYFPRDDRPGQPGFITLLSRLAEIWTLQRAQVEQQAMQLTEAIQQHATLASRMERSSRSRDDLIAALLAASQDAFDPVHGGIGAAPKFPPHTLLRLWLHLQRTQPSPGLLDMITCTLDGMSRGGIHDHVGGGFHRYSTDEHWLLPHFEKMLYDNAQLARVFTEAWELTRHAGYRATAEDLLAWVEREMTGPGGGFYSALDADSAGVEGQFYVWTREEISAILGADAARFCELYQIDAAGNFHDEATGQSTGFNIPHLIADIPAHDVAAMQRCRELLRAARARRIRPGLDDKVLASWNGLMIGAFAHAAGAFNHPPYLDSARRAARFIQTHMTQDQKLRRSWRNQVGPAQGFLEDYGAMIDGFIDLHEASGEAEWLEQALRWADIMVREFHDPDQGGFFSTSAQAAPLIARMHDFHDQAMPSSTSLAIRSLARLAAITGRSDWLGLAEKAWLAQCPLVERIPTGAAALLHASLLLPIHPIGNATRTPAEPAAQVTVEISTKAKHVAPATEVIAEVILEIPPGWHLPASSGRKDHTGLEIEVHGDFVLKEARLPAGETITLPGLGEIRAFQGRITIPITLKSQARFSGRYAVAAVTVHWQACDNERCRLPERVQKELTFRTHE